MCMDRHAYIHIYIYTYVQANVYTQGFKVCLQRHDMQTNTHSWMHVHTHIIKTHSRAPHAHTYIHTFIQTHIHTSNTHTTSSCVYTLVCICRYTCVYKHILCAPFYLGVDTYLFVCICLRVSMYTYIYTRANIHADQGLDVVVIA